MRAPLPCQCLRYNEAQIYLILDMLSQGFPREEMRDDYGVTDEHVQIARHFAAEYLKREKHDAA